MATSDRRLDKQGEQIMSKCLSLSVAHSPARCFSGRYPAAAKTYEYCRKRPSVPGSRLRASVRSTPQLLPRGTSAGLKIFMNEAVKLPCAAMIASVSDLDK
jgi:hypothetical protein